MAEKTYFKKFKFSETFDHLPEQMGLNIRGHLMLTRTKIDMIPAGLKGVFFVFLDKKPRYIAPDFKGIVIYDDFRKEMDNLEIQAAKARYTFDQEMVEKPRYVEEKDGSLSLCSLPTNMHIFHKQLEGYCLDLTRTSVREKQNLSGFKDVILYPKKPIQMEFSFVLPTKITRHLGRQMVREEQRVNA